jgi:hypothetical protein
VCHPSPSSPEPLQRQVPCLAGPARTIMPPPVCGGRRCFFRARELPGPYREDYREFAGGADQSSGAAELEEFVEESRPLFRVDCRLYLGRERARELIARARGHHSQSSVVETNSDVQGDEFEIRIPTSRRGGGGEVPSWTRPAPVARLRLASGRRIKNEPKWQKRSHGTTSTNSSCSDENGR